MPGLICGRRGFGLYERCCYARHSADSYELSQTPQGAELDNEVQETKVRKASDEASQMIWKQNCEDLVNKSRWALEKFDRRRQELMNAARSGTTIDFTTESFNVVYSCDALLNIEKMEKCLNEKVSAVMSHDKTGTDAKMKSHLRTFDFMLSGTTDVKIVDKTAYDVASLFRSNDSFYEGQKFLRALVTIPTSSFPKFGGSRYISVKSLGDHGGQAKTKNAEAATETEHGALVTPTLPVNFDDFWKKKAGGYEKFGPTFVQYMTPCEASMHELDKMTVRTDDGKILIVPLPDKSKPIQESGAERVVVRGDVELGNLQRAKLTFPRQSDGTPLYEVIDGYLENVKYSAKNMTLTLLIPHVEDLLDHSLPFGPSHPAPKHFYHHHNSYSRLFNVEPVSGLQLIERIEQNPNGKLSLPGGAVMEYTIVGIAAAGCGLAAGIGGVLIAETTTAAVIAGVGAVGSAGGLALAIKAKT